MAKKNGPVITHKEILVYAIQDLTRQIREYKEKLKLASDPDLREYIESVINTTRGKLAALEQLYLMETGVVWQG